MEGYDSSIDYAGKPKPMGLLNLLFGRRSNLTIHNDRVWMCTETKFAEVRYDLAHRKANAILLVAHFDETICRLEKLVEEHNRTPIRLVHARDLNPDHAMSTNVETASIDVVCAERHPLWSEDQRVVEFCESMNCRCNLQYHVAVDSPLIARFIDVGILEQLGLRKTESIQSGMISRIIRRAQKQVEAKAVTTFDAVSAEEWFEKNLKEMRKKE
ncbi:MAG: hypothetical protein AB8G99_24110 [Planctomycetaceae bacterium]